MSEYKAGKLVFIASILAVLVFEDEYFSACRNKVCGLSEKGFAGQHYRGCCHVIFSPSSSVFLSFFSVFPAISASFLLFSFKLSV